ncbi:FAD-dependent oxidoreductase [Microbacterium sp. zg.B48]|uniref:FAD-dependent oxidoreductase n=1 Tax=Microbacterium sp. zg.B48 TaxID=2969408 RepID=UPI00214C8D06|nr:FAD-dependent oxidoreductase [Microbacterium sp. zg.B48]MCR2764157.1 FAD-dependent oxidoreductase [Microbacterium sp. zg.B48]
MPDRFSHLILGGGVMGLATAWALTRRGHRPLVLERFERGHRRGASHGATRNYNNAYAEPAYLDLLERARGGWADLGTPGGEPLLRLHGLVSHGRPAELIATEAALHDRGIPAELLSGTEAARRWPGMRFEQTVLHSPDAGVVRASAALRELERRIVALGGEVRYGAEVTAIEPRPDEVTVRVRDDADLTAPVAVVTVGAWSAPLLAGLIALPPLTVTEESPAHFAEVAAPAAWPSFNHLVGVPGDVYGMPTPGEGIKVGFHRVGAVVDPDIRPFTPTHEDALRAYVREWMPGLDADAASFISCTYTSTEGGRFVLDRRGSLVVGAGFSGHGFKFATGIGETLADLAVDPAAQADPVFRLP